MTPQKPLKLLAELTNGESYSTHRRCLDKDLRVEPRDETGTYTFRENGETNAPKQVIDLSSELKRAFSSVFSYFLDGSRRTYKVDDIAYGNRIYPVLAGQVGVSCCYREDPDSFHSVRTENRLILALPVCANATGAHTDKAFFENLRCEINARTILKDLGIIISKVIHYPEKDEYEYENLAIAALHVEMLDMEKEFVNWLVKEKHLSPSKRLIKDGSIEYQKSSSGDFRDLSRLRSNYKCVVGVSKKFNPEKCVDFRGRSNASLIAELPLHHRTPAYKFMSTRAGGADGAIHIAAWYIRLRDIKHTISPFDGVIKAERILVTDKEIENGLDSEEIDFISASLLKERHPTCYGIDKRWANHLYPVYLTETHLKSIRYSDYAIYNML